MTRFGHERQSVCCGASNPLIVGSTPGPAGDLRYGLGCDMELGVGVFVECSLRVLAHAPYQVDETLVENVLIENRCEERFVRILAWSSFSSARRFAQRIAEAAGGFRTDSNYATQ